MHDFITVIDEESKPFAEVRGCQIWRDGRPIADVLGERIVIAGADAGRLRELDWERATAEPSVIARLRAQTQRFR